MFIKTIRHKSNSIRRLINYIHDGMEDQQKDWVMLHNLPSFERNSIAQAYRQNDTFRSNYAKTRWYHEVLSFNPLDRPHINDDMLWKIAAQYIHLRNPNALVYAAPHKSEQHVHIHFIFSGVEYKSRKTLRMDDRTFRKLQRDMERYQLKQHPKLVHSFVYLHRDKIRNRSEERDANTRQEALFQLKRRAPTKVTEKEQLTALVQEQFAGATSADDFFAKLKAQELELYEYRGQIRGVKGKRKYRFSTLGISKQKLRGLEQLAQRLWEMEDLGRQSDNDLDLGR